MEDIIQLLPDHISNQIAAGEVIQRPASAVKELMENSIDAGAKNIKLIVKDSGKTLIQVIDDGKGMSANDLRLSFAKHATSKIKTVEDIFSIYSKGFRGEALASIAAVAQVEIKTRRPVDEIGSKLIIEGSQIRSQEPFPMEAGTQFSMKNIFFNIPARRNFLKSDAEEMRQIIGEFDRLALAHPDIAFSLTHNESEVYNLTPANHRQRIVQVFGKNYNEKLVQIEEKTDYVQIYGFVSKPEAANSKTKGKQYLFVNQRYIKSPYIQHAVYSAYRNLIGEKEYPFYIIYLTIDPAKIDINVSPTKQEIKFEDDALIYQFINATIRRGLMLHNAAPPIDFSVDYELNNMPAMVRPVDRSQIHAENHSSIQVTRPFFAPPKAENRGNWEHFFAQSATEIQEETEHQMQQLLLPNPSDYAPVGKPMLFQQKYIVLPVVSGLMLIDKKRAHERILFDRLQKMSLKGAMVSQRLLFPMIVEFSMQDSFVVQEMMADLNHLGFDIAPMGHNNFAIQGVPTDFANGNEKEFMQELIEEFKNSFKAKSSRKEKLLISIAKIASVKKNQNITEEELHALVAHLFECENFKTSPSAKNIFHLLSKDQIDQFFLP